MVFFVVVLTAGGWIVRNFLQNANAQGLRIGRAVLLEDAVDHSLVAVSMTPLIIARPPPARFNIRGGTSLPPEFFALLVGLVLFTGAFAAEIVRAGILAVSRGQSEAARALGLSESQRLRLIVLPQALRVIIPPMTSQYLNLTKTPAWPSPSPTRTWSQWATPL
jgi:ABC-type amino acid transport system permease subunit